MTDNQIKRIFRRLLWERISRFCAGLSQNVTLILVPGTHSRPISLKFRPIWPLLFVIFVLGIGIGGTLVLSSQARSRLVKAALSGELEDKSQALDDVHVQIEDMVQLMDRFQNTMSLLGSGTQEPDLATDFRAQDFTDITAAVGMVGSSNMSDVERLQLLNTSIENSMSPLRESLNLLSNQQRLLSELPTAWPVKRSQAQISFLFGPNLEPINRSRWYLHRGIDIAGAPGTPILAAANGKVVEVDYSPGGYGNYVVIQHKYGIYTLYAHQQRVFVRLGDIVSQGERLGLMGATGRVTGRHLHFEVRIGSQIIDPLVYLQIPDANRKEIDDFFERRKRRVNYTRGGNH